jgi:hypothetical protein
VHLRAVRQDGEDGALGAQLDIAAGLRDPVGDAGAAVRQDRHRHEKVDVANDAEKVAGTV